jgi:hypothetical protein
LSVIVLLCALFALIPGGVAGAGEHFAPVEGRELIRACLDRLEAAVEFVHTRTLAGMNEGKDVFKLMREVELPPEPHVGPGFGQGSWGRGPVRLDLGVRRDDNDVYGSETSLRTGIVVKAGQGFRLRASYGEAFRAPSLGEPFFPFEWRPMPSRTSKLRFRPRPSPSSTSTMRRLCS